MSHLTRIRHRGRQIRWRIQSSYGRSRHFHSVVFEATDKRKYVLILILRNVVFSFNVTYLQGAKKK